MYQRVQCCLNIWIYLLRKENEQYVTTLFYVLFSPIVIFCASYHIVEINVIVLSGIFTDTDLLFSFNISIGLGICQTEQRDKICWIWILICSVNSDCVFFFCDNKLNVSPLQVMCDRSWMFTVNLAANVFV